MALIYSDLNIYSPTTKPMVTDSEAIKQSIYTILSLSRAEIPFDDTGNEIEDSLFDIVDEVSALEIFRSTTDAVERSEPRVTIDFGKSNVTPDFDNNQFELELWFYIDGYDGQLFKLTGKITP